MKTYRSKDIQEIAGVSKDKLIHWIRTGIIEPYEDKEGRGSSRVFSFRNLVEAMICRELNEFRIEAQAMRLMMLTLRHAKGLWWEGGPKLNFWQALEQEPTTILDVNRLFVLHKLEDDPRAWGGIVLMSGSKELKRMFELYKGVITINLTKVVKEVMA